MKSAFLSVAVSLLGVSAVWSQEPTPTEAQQTLYWSNGDRLRGDIVRAEQSSLFWKSPLFVDALELDISALNVIRFPYMEGAHKTDQPVRIVMRNGDVLLGDLVKIDNQFVQLDGPRHNTLKLRRTQVRSIQRLDNPALVFLGPGGLKGWSGSKRSQPARQWKELADGRLSTTKEDASLFRGLELPPKSEIEFVVQSTANPVFVLALADQHDESVRLETWDNELVALTGDDFESVQTLKETDRKVHLRLYWDREAGKLSVYSSTGKHLVDIAGENPPNAKPGLFISNKGPNLTVSRIRVNLWSGDPPREVREGQGRIHLTDGSIRYGRVDAFAKDGGQLSIAEEAATQDVPFQQVDTIYLADDSEDLVDELPVRVSWHDGGLVSGELVSIQGNVISLETRYSETPVASRLVGARRVRLPANAKKPDREPDRLYCSGGLLRGTLEGADNPESPIRWKPVGGRNASPLAPGSQARFVRGDSNVEASFDPEMFRDLLFLESNDVLPCRVEAVDDTSLHVATAFAEARRIPLSHVKAVELATEGTVQQFGFGDEKWRVVRGGQSVKRTPEDVKFTTPAAFGHPSILAGGDVRFHMKWNAKSMSMLTIRAFAEDMNRPKGSVNLTFMCRQSQIWVSEGNGRGPIMFGRQQQNVGRAPGSQATIKLSVRDGKLHVAINDRNVYSSRLNRQRIAGKGLVFEVNQNFGSGSALTLSGFEVRNSGGTAVRRFVDQEARERTLTVPRFRRQNPPTHVLIAHNGDLLRGRLAGLDGQIVRFESRLEMFRIPRNRVAAVIWLHAEDDKPEELKNETSSPLVRVLLDGGVNLTMNAESMADGLLSGHAPVLGRCAIPSNGVRELQSGGYGSLKDVPSYADWMAANAIAPRWSESSSGAAGDGRQFIGQQMEDFELPLLADGERFRLSDHENKIVVLDFWATWCGPCVRSMPEYLDAIRGFEEDEVVFLAVNQAESGKAVRDFLKEQEWDVTVGMDRGQEIADMFGVTGIPHTVVLGHGGIVENVMVGFREGGGRDLRDTIEKILAGKWVRPNPESSGATDGSDAPLVGTDAKDFSAPLLEGGTFKLSDQKGKVIVLDFWATWCGPCVRAMPAYRDALKEFDPEKVQIVAVNQAESAPTVKRFVEQRRWDLTIVMDRDQKIAESLQVDDIPHTLVIGPTGRIEWGHIGYRDGVEESLAAAVKRVLEAAEQGEDAAEGEAKEEGSTDEGEEAPADSQEGDAPASGDAPAAGETTGK